MSEGFAPIDVRQLEELLRDEPFVARLVVQDSVGSTNDVLRRLALDGAPQGTVVLAEHQTRARGRLGRSWHSPRGLGLFVSTLLRPSAPAAELTRWTLAAAVAACRACREACAREIAIKWPNDLVWGGRKLGGVLAEARGAGSDRSELIIGTGINVRHEPEDLPVESCGRATSLQQATGGTAPGREPEAVV